MRLTTKIPFSIIIAFLIAGMLLQHFQILRLWSALSRMAELQAEAGAKLHTLDCDRFDSQRP